MLPCVHAAVGCCAPKHPPPPALQLVTLGVTDHVPLPAHEPAGECFKQIVLHVLPFPFLLLGVVTGRLVSLSEPSICGAHHSLCYPILSTIPTYRRDTGTDTTQAGRGHVAVVFGDRSLAVGDGSRRLPPASRVAALPAGHGEARRGYAGEVTVVCDLMSLCFAPFGGGGRRSHPA